MECVINVLQLCVVIFVVCCVMYVVCIVEVDFDTPSVHTGFEPATPGKRG